MQTMTMLKPLLWHTSYSELILLISTHSLTETYLATRLPVFLDGQLSFETIRKMNILNHFGRFRQFGWALLFKKTGNF